jgi:hypothetical protein
LKRGSSLSALKNLESSEERASQQRFSPIPRKGSPLSKRNIHGPAACRKPRAPEAATAKATGTGAWRTPWTMSTTWPRYLPASPGA